MLPLLITFLLAVYVLGPDLIARWLISFSVPRRAVVQSRSEEWSRSILWCLLPLTIAWLWIGHSGEIKRYGGRASVETVFSGLYSEPYFVGHRSEFFSAFSAFWWMNFGLLWRLYLVVVLVSLGLIFIIGRYGSIRKRLEPYPFLKRCFATIVLPRVSDWHVLLSRMLLPSKNLEVVVDILTKSDSLYQGKLADKTLGSDGSLVNITLSEPSKFRRQRYLEAVHADPNTAPSSFWHEIPGDSFVLMASEVASLNVRYVRAKMSRNGAPDVVAALRELAQSLENASPPNQPKSSDQFSK